MWQVLVTTEVFKSMSANTQGYSKAMSRQYTKEGKYEVTDHWRLAGKWLHTLIGLAWCGLMINRRWLLGTGACNWRHLSFVPRWIPHGTGYLKWALHGKNTCTSLISWLLLLRKFIRKWNSARIYLKYSVQVIVTCIILMVQLFIKLLVSDV